MKTFISIALALCLALSLVSCGGAPGSTAPESTEQGTSASVDADQDKSLPAPIDSQEEPKVDETIGQANARKAAASYLSFSAFSYDGLIKQLEFEKYSTEEATYAADNCGADWNEQALSSGKKYLDTAAFSYSGLIKQLEFEKYSSEQAKYAADNCGGDWNEQAAKSAKSYLEISSFSKQGLIDQLVFEGFTSEQAEHGAAANNY